MRNVVLPVGCVRRTTPSSDRLCCPLSAALPDAWGRRRTVPATRCPRRSGTEFLEVGQRTALQSIDQRTAQRRSQFGQEVDGGRDKFSRLVIECLVPVGRLREESHVPSWAEQHGWPRLPASSRSEPDNTAGFNRNLCEGQKESVSHSLGCAAPRATSTFRCLPCGRRLRRL